MNTTSGIYRILPCTVCGSQFKSAVEKTGTVCCGVPQPLVPMHGSKPPVGEGYTEHIVTVHGREVLVLIPPGVPVETVRRLMEAARDSG